MHRGHMDWLADNARFWFIVNTESCDHRRVVLWLGWRQKCQCFRDRLGIPARSPQIKLGRRLGDWLATRPEPGGFFMLPPLVMFEPVITLRRSLAAPSFVGGLTWWPAEFFEHIVARGSPMVACVAVSDKSKWGLCRGPNGD